MGSDIMLTVPERVVLSPLVLIVMSCVLPLDLPEPTRNVCLIQSGLPDGIVFASALHRLQRSSVYVKKEEAFPGSGETTGRREGFRFWSCACPKESSGAGTGCLSA